MLASGYHLNCLPNGFGDRFVQPRAEGDLADTAEINWEGLGESSRCRVLVDDAELTLIHVHLALKKWPLGNGRPLRRYVFDPEISHCTGTNAFGGSERTQEFLLVELQTNAARPRREYFPVVKPLGTFGEADGDERLESLFLPVSVHIVGIVSVFPCFRSDQGNALVLEDVQH